MDKTFHISAKLGDIIYSLPSVKLMGGGTYIYGNPDYKGYLLIKPLLESQSYIKECKYISEVSLPKDFINLDLFRNVDGGNKFHLADVYLKVFGFKSYNWSEDYWLDNIENNIEKSYSIINRTERYNDKFFNWKSEIKFLKENSDTIYFMGLDYEYNNFIKKYKCKDLQHYKVSNYLDAAYFIAGAKFFSGNQSSLLAIRQGLGLPYRMEQSPNHIDCNQYSNNETILNPLTRRAHLLAYTIKRIIKGI